MIELHRFAAMFWAVGQVFMVSAPFVPLADGNWPMAAFLAVVAIPGWINHETMRRGAMQWTEVHP